MVWADRRRHLMCPFLCHFILFFEKYAQKLPLRERTELHQPFSEMASARNWLFSEVFCEDTANSEGSKPGDQHGYMSSWASGYLLNIPKQCWAECPRERTQWRQSENLQGALRVEQMNGGTVSVYLNTRYSKITLFSPPLSPCLLLISWIPSGCCELPPSLLFRDAVGWCWWHQDGEHGPGWR